MLELGSGVGLLGVGLAMTTDCDVTLTDPDIETNFSDGTSMSTLEWLQRNIDLNVNSKRARARRLVWGNADDARALLRDGGFDLLVGSDLLYDTANYGPLVDSIVALAPARGAICRRVTRHGARDIWPSSRRRADLSRVIDPLVGEGLTKAATATTLTRRDAVVSLQSRSPFANAASCTACAGLLRWRDAWHGAAKLSCATSPLHAKRA